MTDIEQKALAMVREVLNERNLSDKRAVRREVSPYTEALCRAIEHHEAFRQEVSDAVGDALFMAERHCECDNAYRLAGNRLGHLIIPKPKPDPLAQILGAFDGTLWEPEDVLRFRAALEARGLEIREKNDG